MDALVFGSVIADVTVHAKKIKKVKSGTKEYLGLDYGSKIDVDRIEINSGGSAHNVAYGLAKLNRRVGLIGNVGNDPFGDKIYSELQDANVDVTHLKRKGRTGTSIIIIGEDNERSILISRDANDFITADLDKNEINNSRWFVFTSVLGQRSLTELRKVMKLGKKYGVKLVANPSISMVKERTKELIEFIKLSDVVIMNEEEAKLLTGKKLTDALTALRKFGPDTVVITLGSKGVVALHDDETYKQESYKTKVVDTTGAGDAFTTGFLHSLMRKDSIEYALKFGCACSAFNVKSYGAVKNFPTEDDIIKMIGERNV